MLLILFSLNFISAITLDIDSTVIRGEGLNTDLNITFPITFDVLNVTESKIEFTNLWYQHSLSCDRKTSYYETYTIISSNSLLSTLDFPKKDCDDPDDNIKGAGGSIFTQYLNKSNETDMIKTELPKQQDKCDIELDNEFFEDYINLFSVKISEDCSKASVLKYIFKIKNDDGGYSLIFLKLYLVYIFIILVFLLILMKVRKIDYFLDKIIKKIPKFT